jgi:methionyl aminopeptidase
MIKLKSSDQIDILDEANKIVHKVLDKLEAHISIGMITKELDEIANDYVSSFQAIPVFKGYMGYPSSICISINEEVVHGIPSDRVIQSGDIISIDFGAIYKGFVGDAARTIIIGDTTKEKIDLVNNTKLALYNGIQKMYAGNRLYDISDAIDSVAKKYKYGNVKQFCGHGVGEQMHEDPKILNYISLDETNIHLKEGMVFALEPMFSLGSGIVKVLNDQWTVSTIDSSVAAHWELSVAITKDGPKILGRKSL